MLFAAVVLLVATSGRGVVIAAETTSDNTTATGWEDEAAIAAYEDQARAAGALGFYQDDRTNSLVVLVPAAHLDAFGASRPTAPPVSVSILPTSFDEPILQAARDRLTALMKDHPHDAMAFGLEPDTQKLGVVTTIDYAVVPSALGPYENLMNYHSGSVEQASRQADVSPFYGGASLAKSQSDHRQSCTTGMKVFRSGAAALVTAAHCGNPGTAKYTPAGANVGTMGTWEEGTYRCGTPTGDDMALISGKSYGPRIYLGGVNSTTSGPVVGAGNPAEGVAQYRYSGAASGEHGPYEVTNDDWSTYMDPDSNACNPWVIHSLYIQASGGGCAVVGGDSGAPFYYRDIYNNVQIRGMIFAMRTDGAACFAEKWSRIASGLSVTIATT